MAKVDNDMEEYLSRHTSPMADTLMELTRFTYLSTCNPRMISGPIQGKFLQLLCNISRPNRILEVGTFTGYTSICMALGSPPHTVIDTIEVNDELEETIQTYTSMAGVDSKIRLHLGDACQIIPTLDYTYGFAYIDGDKREYPEYYKLVLPKVNSGGLIIADNVLWGGKVVDASENDEHTKALRAFNTMVQNDMGVENVLLPLRDGIMLIYKL